MILEGNSHNELINPGTMSHYKASGLYVMEGELTIEGEDTSYLLAVSKVDESTVGAGIMVNGGRLTIKGGHITAAGSGFDISGNSTGAGINVRSTGQPVLNNNAFLTIEGGTVIAVGRRGGAGIGGAFMGMDNILQPVGNINITGGVVIAKGQDRNDNGGGAGIGGGGRHGDSPQSSYNGGVVKITGGTVIAEGGDGYTDDDAHDGGSGIGGGGKSKNTDVNAAIGGDGGMVDIHGGTVYVKGGVDALGIGPGKGSKPEVLEQGSIEFYESGYGANAVISITGGALVFASSVNHSGYNNGGNTDEGILIGGPSPIPRRSSEPVQLPVNELEFPAALGLITFTPDYAHDKRMNVFVPLKKAKKPKFFPKCFVQRRSDVGRGTIFAN